MNRSPLAALALASAALPALHLAAGPAHAAPAYIALGDSITFGETDLAYVRDDGTVTGYPTRYADYLGRTTGTRPALVNLAIDGETAASFFSGAGRTPPVVGRTDVPLQEQNTNYTPGALVPQATRFAQVVDALTAAGDTVETVSITLGFNEVAALTTMPTQDAIDAIPATLDAYRQNYADVLTTIRERAPGADLFVLNYFNPFPGDPTGANPASPVFAVAGPQLNAVIADLASQFGANLVDNATPFLGREAELTFIDEIPAGAVVPEPHPFGSGVAPIGDVHPNAAGYDVINQAVIAASGNGGGAAVVPLPSGVASGAAMLLVVGAAVGVRRRRATA